MMLPKAVLWDKDRPNDEALEYIMRNMRMSRVNQTMLHQYEAKLEDFLGRTPYDFFEHDLDQERKLLRNILNLGKFRERTEERTDSGRIVIFEGDYSVIYSQKGEVMGVMGVQQDITEKVNQLHAIQSQNQKLLDIAWMQSHIVRSPLARIMSLSDLMHLEDAGNLELAALIRESAEELDQVLQKIVEKAEQVRLDLK